jgi:ABC-type phosphate transport system permease subunit
MFKPSTLKTISYIALVCCSLGVLFAILISIIEPGFRSYISILSWALLIYSSWLATRLSGYELYEEDLKTLGYYVYGILILFILYLLINLSLGILPAIFLAVKLHNQKTGFDSWMREKASILPPVSGEGTENS